MRSFKACQYLGFLAEFTLCPIKDIITSHFQSTSDKLAENSSVYFQITSMYVVLPIMSDGYRHA